MKRLSISGILFGGVIDVVTTGIVGLPIMFIAAMRVNVTALPSGFSRTHYRSTEDSWSTIRQN